MPIVARAGRAVARDYGGSGRPVLFVPSLINPAYVLDLAESNSLLRWLATQGVRPLLVEWGSPTPAERDLTIAGHVETMLLPLIEAIGERTLLAGYCLGGTMALAAAARTAVAGLAMIAAPWRFAGFSARSRDGIADLWTQAEPAAQVLGLLPIEVLQHGFWKLDPRRTVSKFERFATLPPESPEAEAFVALEDWANDGPPLTLAAGRDLVENFIVSDIPGSGAWQVGGAPVTPETLACPILDVVSTSDRITPAPTAVGIGERWELAQGHVGMIVGGRARQALWEPLARWLSRDRDS